MTFVRRVVEVRVADWSPAAVPELAHAAATITRPNAKATIRMESLLLSGAPMASRVNGEE
jgi:hypothetical protein